MFHPLSHLVVDLSQRECWWGSCPCTHKCNPRLCHYQSYFRGKLWSPSEKKKDVLKWFRFVLYFKRKDLQDTFKERMMQWWFSFWVKILQCKRHISTCLIITCLVLTLPSPSNVLGVWNGILRCSLPEHDFLCSWSEPNLLWFELEATDLPGSHSGSILLEHLPHTGHLWRKWHLVILRTV